MPIVIRRVGELYEAEASPPHGGGQPWRTSAPTTLDALIAFLLERGFHQTDIGDALYEADPDWEKRVKSGS